MDCPLPTIHFFMWKFYQVFMLCINIFSYQVFSNLSPLCSVLVSISPCSAALTNKPWNSGAQPSYRTLISQSDISQAALLGSSSPTVTQGFQLIPSVNSAISELSASNGEEEKGSGECTPTLNCLRMEATHHSTHIPPGESLIVRFQTTYRGVWEIQGRTWTFGQHCSAIGSPSKDDYPVCRALPGF